eukprot:gnl/Chilomastix_caulleri/320.p1 GENE.gnl/Chilomastix_caulleri/320~~gnl/Chilomastix_caulleri/320.p1  ORF type:complete len:220 (-),score=47.61 gnl/Chilomastix_caulleri/320:39-698(-)
MSRFNPEQLTKAISEMLDHSRKIKPRGFVETVDIQVGIKDYDLKRDKPINSTLALPAIPNPEKKVAIICDAFDMDRAKAIGLDYYDLDTLGLFNKDPKKVKKFARKYDVFLASASVHRRIVRVLGPGLNKAGKFPNAISTEDDLQQKVNEARATIKFQLKKVLCMSQPVGNVKMSESALRKNITLCINFIVSLFAAKRGWQNIRSIHIKSTMGPSFKIL